MQPAQHAADRFRMVVLHELDIEPGGFAEGFAVVALEEESALVPEDFGFDDQDVGDGGTDDLHQNTRSLSTLFRYCP